MRAASWLRSTCAVLALLAPGCASAPAPVEPAREDKLARLLSLEDQRSLGQGEVVARLAEPDARTRARAALVLGRVGEVSAAAPLVTTLSDPSAYVRSTAAFALGLLELDVAELPQDAVAALTEALHDPDERVRGRAAEALARKQGKTAAEPIAKALVDWLPAGQESYDWTEDLEVSSLRFARFDLRLGVLALGRIRNLQWSWNVLATPGGTPRFVWWPAAWAASRFDAEEMQPLFLFYAGSPDPAYRVWGARGLGSLTPERSKDHVRLLLFDPNEKVRIEAVRAAAALRLHELAPDLLDRVSADTRYVQIETLRALAELRAPDAVEPLIDLLGSPSPWVRANVLPALARQDPEGFWLLLSGLGEDPAWEVRAALADLMGRLSGDRAVSRARAMANDPDPRVRARALAAFAHHGAVATEVLLEHLGAEDPFERAAAAEGLNRLAELPEDAAERVRARFADETHPLAASRLLSTLGSLDPSSAERTAREALGDERYVVRRSAARLLVRIGAEPRPPPVSPVETARSLEDYASLVDPPFSPQAFVRTSRGPIELELFVADAPLTVANFVSLAREGFYDGLPVSRVVPNGFVRSGDPRGDGHGGPDHTIRSEINERPFLRGTLAMHDTGKDTAGSQFFITHWPMPELDGRFTVFGQVTRGMAVVDLLEPGDVIEEIAIWDGVTSPYATSSADGATGTAPR